MRRAKRVVLFLAASFIAILVLAFVLENQQGASLTFFGWSTVELPVSVFLTLALILGLLVGPVLALLVRGSARR
ncbi:lipopolysaccharide assembly protein LapA domain-containing protein [Pseudomonas sp. CHM02]|uniref:lipopolysaccharide assembly protein LapA domain-containing protein n=1 Tax=Pseudomonas sp. CHM02 TaxID=1463662 RepID=UPI0005BBCECB|nr:lipopolysaccharide assembly protein LapA domain-containing protein [Pseudomonas sp. CHM02]